MIRLSPNQVTRIREALDRYHYNTRVKIPRHSAVEDLVEDILIIALPQVPKESYDYKHKQEPRTRS